MTYNRRNFIKISSGTLGALAFGSSSSLSMLSSCGGNKGFEPFGLMLYTLRDLLPADPGGVLKQVASFGYKQVESYEGDKGMFWGLGAKGFKKQVDDLGMKLISSHCNIEKDFEQKAAEAASIGMKYLICPWKGPQGSIDKFKQFADQFNKAGEVCKKNGIRFAYHNHDYSFKPLEGQIPQEVMMNNTDPALVDYQMDIYWVVTAGEDPVKWFKKYPNRFRLCHIKDRIKGSSEQAASCNLGQGSIDFPTILKAGREQGLEYFMVEQERYDNTTPLKAAEADAAYMKSLKS